MNGLEGKVCFVDVGKGLCVGGFYIVEVVSVVMDVVRDCG